MQLMQLASALQFWGGLFELIFLIIIMLIKFLACYHYYL